MSVWKDCGHEVSGTEQECLYCRIADLEAVEIALAGAIIQLTEEYQRLKNLKAYIAHKPNCNKLAVKRMYDAHCDCGLETLLPEKSDE